MQVAFWKEVHVNAYFMTAFSSINSSGALYWEQRVYHLAKGTKLPLNIGFVTFQMCKKFVMNCGIYS